MILPGPREVEAVRNFLQESSGLFVEHVEFGLPAAGVAIKAHFRSPKGVNRILSAHFPDARDRADLEDAIVTFSGRLDAEAGLARRPVMAQ